MRRRFIAVPLLVASLAGAGFMTAALASSGSGARGTTSRAHGNLRVTIAIKRFRASRPRTIARGVAVARLTGVGGKSTVIRQPVTLSVTRGGTCQILSLVLDQLNLSLLGLNVHLDKVNLKITGQRRGGILGRLFCRLASAKAACARAAAPAPTAQAKKHAIH